MNKLESLSKVTTIVADTGDIESIARLKPQDATTNPSLILKSAKDARYRNLLTAALAKASSFEDAVDRVLVNFGSEILQNVPGRISTEVDARLSFDTEATVAKARRIIELYREKGIAPSRVLIKIAATWEGLKACRILESEGIHCNMTLIFAQVQAEVASASNATLISPFVGRIYDWYKKKAGDAWVEEENAGENDPGVKSVRRIYERLKGCGSKTEIMGASFRNVGQILALAGCDLLTISPALLDQLSSMEGTVYRGLSKPEKTYTAEPILESDYRFLLNQDAMANEKLAEGIRAFVADTEKLEALLSEMAVQG
jgi:transaldolase